MRDRITTACLALALCAGLPARVVADEVLPSDLRRVLSDYEAAWRAGDAAALSRLFVDGETSVSNSSACAPSTSRADIARCYAGQGGALSLRGIAHGVDGRLAYIVGEYAEKPDSPPLGKFVLTLERGDDGRWLIVADMDRAYRKAQ